MGVWERFRKGRAIRGYLAECGALLVARYGAEAQYAPARTLRTLAVGRLNVAYAEYACAMFASEEQFIDWAAREHEHKRAEVPARLPGKRAYRDRAVSQLQAETLETPSRKALATRYAELRHEVAERYNGGSYRFLPGRVLDHNWTPVDNDGATGTKISF